MSTQAFNSGTGRRKTAVARVRLLPDEGEIRLPFRVTNTDGRYNAMIKVEGGGVTGQAGAVKHGIARALLEIDPEGHRLALRQANLLTRDPRMKERKKY